MKSPRKTQVSRAVCTAAAFAVLVLGVASVFAQDPPPAPSEVASPGPQATEVQTVVVADALLREKVVGVAYETVQLESGALPLLAPMSEVAGRMAPQLGAHFLEERGQGDLGDRGHAQLPMVKFFRMPPAWPLNSCASWFGSMPGTGMCAPMR